jgi:hypothetical protein
MARIPLYEKRPSVSAEYGGAKLDPNVASSLARADQDFGEAVSRVGNQIAELKTRADDADYETFSVAKQGELEALRVDAMVNKGASYDTVYDDYIAPELEKIESEIKSRGYGLPNRYLNRWKLDSEKIRLNAQKEQIALKLTDYEDKIVQEANMYYKNDDMETGDAKIGELAKIVGEAKAREHQSKGRYNYVLNKIITTNDPNEINKIVNDKKYTDALNFSQFNQLKNQAIYRQKTLLESKVKPAMDNGDKLLKQGLLDEYWVADNYAKGNLNAQQANYYREAIALQSERFAQGLVEDADGDLLSRRGQKRVANVKRRIVNYMNGEFKGEALDELDDIMSDINKINPTPMIRSKLLSPITNAMGNENTVGFFVGGRNKNDRAFDNIEARAMLEYTKQFNALTGSMPADLRDTLYTQTIFELEEFLRGIKKGTYEVDGQKIRITSGKEKVRGVNLYNEVQKDDNESIAFQNEINVAVRQVLAPVRQKAVVMPLKPSMRTLQVQSDPLDEFFPVRDNNETN